jgi:hypothetical protein
METCKNGTCEYNPTLNRQRVNRTSQQERYGTLWAEIELPKQLAGEK